jgi:hypothetical protein
MLRTRLASLPSRAPLPAPTIIVVGNTVAPESELQLNAFTTAAQNAVFENTNIAEPTSRGEI